MEPQIPQLRQLMVDQDDVLGKGAPSPEPDPGVGDVLVATVFLLHQVPLHGRDLL
jgi:hypothetical protein